MNKTEKYDPKLFKYEIRSFDVYTLEGGIEDAIEDIQTRAEGLIDPTISIDKDWGHDYCDINVEICGWRPWTDEELDQQRQLEEKMLQRKKAEAEAIKAREIDTLKKLRMKYPNV